MKNEELTKSCYRSSKILAWRSLAYIQFCLSVTDCGDCGHDSNLLLPQKGLSTFFVNLGVNVFDFLLVASGILGKEFMPCQ